MATKYFALVHCLTARSNEITHHIKRDDGISEGEVTPKSCTSVTVTVDKIVVALGEKSAAALGEKSAAGMVTVKITEEVITVKIRSHHLVANLYHTTINQGTRGRGLEQPGDGMAASFLQVDFGRLFSWGIG